jgi:ATP-dependent Lon protease
VYPVGGIREKLLAAKRQKLKRVIIPAENRRDYDEVPEHIRRGIEVHFVDTFADVVEIAF